MTRLLLRLGPALLLAGLAAPLACDEGGPTDTPPEDDMYPLTDPNALLEGAPDNSELPGEGKADEILPARYDLVMTQSPVRSQGRRGVCSIFGSIAERLNAST